MQLYPPPGLSASQHVPVYVVLVVVGHVIVQHQHQVLDVEAARSHAGGDEDAADVTLEVGHGALTVALVLAAVQTQAGVAVSEQVSKQCVTLLLFVWGEGKRVLRVSKSSPLPGSIK